MGGPGVCPAVGEAVHDRPGPGDVRGVQADTGMEGGSMSTPPIYTEEAVDYEMVREGDYVVLKVPGREYLFDPITARNLGAAFMQASRDITDEWRRP